MPAAVDLSFERFLIKRDPLPSPPLDLVDRKRPEPLHRQLMARIDYDDSEVDELRDGPLNASSYSRPSARLDTRVHQQSLPHFRRILDEDYDGMDVSSDMEPVPQTPMSAASDGDSLSVSSMKDEMYDEEPEYKMEYDGGYDSASSEDRPLSASPQAALHPAASAQEQPTIATIEDEQSSTALGRASTSHRSSAGPSTVPIPRAKTRSYSDQHSSVPLVCLIDDCTHTSWMPKEREKHMDTHFHKRWQCGNCRKFYSTSYTLKRHSDSTHVPDACKGAYEAGLYTSVKPYWQMPEFVDRVRMPAPEDYLYALLTEVFKERDELQAKGELKRPLPTEIQATASGPVVKRARKSRAVRKASDAAPPVKTEALEPANALHTMSPSPEEDDTPPLVTDPSDETSDTPSSPSLSPSPEAFAEMDVPMTEPEVAVKSVEAHEIKGNESDRDSIRTVIQNHAPVESQRRTAKDLCWQLWVVDHPGTAPEEFDRYWTELELEERQAYELLAKRRETRRS